MARTGTAVWKNKVNKNAAVYLFTNFTGTIQYKDNSTSKTINTNASFQIILISPGHTFQLTDAEGSWTTQIDLNIWEYVSES